jgi:hypothetical protein
VKAVKTEVSQRQGSTGPYPSCPATSTEKLKSRRTG